MQFEVDSSVLSVFVEPLSYAVIIGIVVCYDMATVSTAPCVGANLFVTDSKVRAMPTRPVETATRTGSREI
jgi:hypothetical protein